ncbi:Single-stranded nucleic acid binding R3H [Metarhizium album ARSEF 1941]|uniref:Single-stranded nucleic acid binding R3H n=1 Tax=Metarhizium album (strain ARSEF 1941) TaxID=1081103 RepID=A0A0B2WS19_METAS|nr:Single-stranded nucleic acid binding R3H [Metarhizium album ARSEF 1941]KHN96444.1 Single-stranded nucleic acid binding R3H [Metarhizium album ARSEF 1941]
MTEAEGSQAQSQSQRVNRGRNHGHRRGRGGKSRQPIDGFRSGGPSAAAPSETFASQAGTQAYTQLSSQEPASPIPFDSNSNQRGRGRRPRGPRQAGRGAARNDAPGSFGHRSFGGHLTGTTPTAAENAAHATPALSADAPEFIPGEAVVTRRPAKTKHRVPIKPPVRLPKSTAEDLGTRIHEDISNLNYECAICTDDVVRNSHVWSCSLCWTVVHLKCVNKWHDNQRKQQDPQSSEPEQDLTWRCPGCNSKLSDDPGSYHCWCGKDINPRPAPSSLPPHSCGQTCSKPRPTCPHPCPLQCHAGPCPPCGLMGPTQSCFCGKKETRKLCRETDYENGWSCQEICGDLLPCGEHSCSKPCHSGLCGDCDMTVDAKCYCGRVEKQMPCCEREEPQMSYNVANQSWFDGTFTCAQLCERSFDCGVHKCSEACHPQEEQPAHCPYSPASVARCPCGKTPLDELLENARTSCEDPIPHCEKPCHKKLPCGHLCVSKCHTGDCGFCNETMEVACRCGRTSTRSVCHQGNVQNPMCMRTCQATLSCGRHRCGEHCCAGEKKAAERQAARRKHKLPGAATSIEAEHICIKTCGRRLKCGSHECQQICHRGPCASCPEAIFTEISCDCGRTVLHPPQPCGTRPPDCRFDCLRRPSCGHPSVQHNCHAGDVSCPKCPFLVEKWCACGKEKLHSQPCHLQEAHCGRVCGTKLKCRLHSCKKLCHRPGECEDANLPGKHCEQTCGKIKLFCEHPCQNACHGQTPCNESSACTAKAVISCPCGIRTQEVKCLASSSNPTPSRIEIKCDDECLRLERNRRLAAALNIDPASHQSEHIPYSETTLRLFKANTSWAETQEREFRVFAQSPSETRLRYKPMSATYRQFLHVLAEDYGLESRSEDVEPYRCVVVFKGSRFVSAPGKTLSQCAEIRAAQAVAAASAAASRAPSPPPRAQDPLNGFLLTSPRFGLTIGDVRSALDADLSSQPSVHFETTFLPSDEVLLRATTPYSSFLSAPALEQALVTLKPRLAKTVQDTAVAGKLFLCHVDAAGQVARRDDASKTDASGWSAVAGRAAARPNTAAAEEASTTTGRRLLGLRKKKIEKERPWTQALDGDVEC